MLAEEFLRPAPGQRGGVLVVTGALVAIKAVRGPGIDVSVRLRLLLLDARHHIHRDAFVLLAEMHLQRAFRLLVGELADHAAVIGDRRRQTGNSTSSKKR